MDIAKLAHEHRNLALHGKYSIMDYAYTIQKAVDQGRVCCAIENGKLVGFCQWTPYPSIYEIYIDNIVGLNKWCIRTFLLKFKELYPGFGIVAHRRGKSVTYNTEKLLEKFNIN